MNSMGDETLDLIATTYAWYPLFSDTVGFLVSSTEARKQRCNYPEIVSNILDRVAISSKGTMKCAEVQALLGCVILT